MDLGSIGTYEVLIKLCYKLIDRIILKAKERKMLIPEKIICKITSDVNFKLEPNLGIARIIPFT